MPVQRARHNAIRFPYAGPSATCLHKTSPYFAIPTVMTKSTLVGASKDDKHEDFEVNEALPTPSLSSNVPVINFPTTPEMRAAYRTKDGRKLTAHQWAVYDFALTIPVGKVTTYKDVAAAAGGSPRSVGNALRNNPFAPYVPCHRVIASSFFVGGFFGEWGKDHKTGTRYNQKLDILSREGVKFSDKGLLISKHEDLWSP